MEEASAYISYGSGEVEEHTVKSEEEDVSEEQKDDAATDKLRVVQNNNNETTQSAVKRMPTAATQTVVTKEGICDNDELKKSVAEELTTTSADCVTKEEQEELMTTSFDYVTKKDKSDMMASGGLETQMAVKEDLDESNGGHCGGRAVADHLDELMDMGAVDQEEQEALMKDEEEDMSDSDDSWPTTDAVEKETRPSSLDSSIKVVKHRLQTATPPRLRSPTEDPPSPSLVTVKDEPIDEEYNQALFSSSSAPTDDIKDEPETPKEAPSWHTRKDADVAPPTMQFHPARPPGVQLSSADTRTPHDLFKLFFAENTIRTLCSNTNKQAARNAAKGCKYEWTDVVVTEFYKYIGLLFYMVTMKLDDIRDYWRENCVFSVAFPATVMTMDRYRTISWNLHLSDPDEDQENDGMWGTPEHDSLFRVKPLMDVIRQASKACYHPGKNLAVDERRVAVVTKSGMTQDMEATPSKVGFKLFVLADASNGYTVDFAVYTGKYNFRIAQGLAYDSVMSLVNPSYLGSGYHVYMEDFYTSPKLFRDLLAQRFAACGTYRDNRKDCPCCAGNTLDKRSAKGSLRWIRDGPLVFVKWMDTREVSVSVCSTIHAAFTKDTTKPKVKPTTRALSCPEPITDYNRYMGGFVDWSDQLIQYYTAQHKTIKWYRKLFLHFLDIAATNAYILHKELTSQRQKETMTHKAFMLELTAQLCGVSQKVPAKQSRCDHVPIRVAPQNGHGQNGDDKKTTSYGRRTCILCRMDKGKGVSTPWKCKACDELMISSVFSVEGKSSSARLALRPTPSLAKAIPLPASARTSSTLCVVCSLCKKFLIKGQTAYQKKGSPELFCSPICLSAKPQEPATKICHHCHKSLLRPQDLILAPIDSGSIREFCSANCLTGFNNTQAASLKAKNPAPVPKTCSMCKKPVRTSNKHEVELQGVTHHICSNACFCRFRTIHKLNVSTCVSCGEYFASKILMLSTTGGNKSLCSDACLATFKKQSTTSHACSMCATVTLLSDTVHTANNLGVVEIFCTTGCLLAHKIQSISSSGTLLPCDNCEMQKVPAYHLAMSDSSIRNFCSLPCVLGFQEKHHKTPKGGTTASQYPIVSVARENATAAVPAAAIAASAIPRQAIPTPTILRPANTTTTTSTSSLKEASSKSPTPKLECPMCDQAIVSYPEVIQEKDKMVFLCGLECAEKFKVVHCWESRCEYCKLLKVPADVKRIGSKNCSFCSEGCKLLYKHELSKQWGSHCRCCAYCFSISRSQVTTRYSGKMEEFCSEHCRNKYTLLIQKLAMCETCHSRGKLSMTLPLLGNPKRFCRLHCLLKFCCAQRTPDQTPAKKREAEALASSDLESTPVIANVISLASRLPTQPNAPPSVAQQGTCLGHKDQMALCERAGTQTDTVKAPPPPVKSLKNKALLCRPMVQHQGVACKPDMVDTEVQTDEPIRVIMVPVPVPVYVPVPMAMYSQYCPAPMSMPLPLPVPMMLPVTLDSAERVVETIRQIKDKIPADPLEADLILMAEIVAEQEEREGKEEREGRGRVQEEREMVKEEREGKKKKAEKRTRAVEEEKDGLDLLNEYINNYSSSDLDPEIPDSLLGTWQDSPSAIGLQTDSRPLAREKLQPIRDIPVGGSLELPVPSPPPGPLPMDIEADIPVETLEQLETARLSQKKQSDAKRRVVPNRRQRKARDKKRGRPVAEAPESSEVASRAPKLESKYGIDAWERWVRWRKSQPDLQTPCINSRPLELKEDVLRCTTTELSYGLCRFTMEVKRPNGEPYLPDSLFYLCLGIQQHLFENGRVENIFTDVFYNKFSMEITKLLKDFKPSITRSGYIHSRVEEEYLWDCKQLGAYSPIVLLNTLLFFCSKYLGFTTVRQHRRLSFAHFMRCSRNNPDNTKTIFLRFYPPVAPSSAAKQQPADTDGSAAKRSRQDEEKMLDMVENQENPLRCPIRLYEFYLSKCSETVKQRSNVFYLRPERSCVPNSPLWFSGTSLDDVTLGGMLTRILSVREMHLSPPSDNAAAAAAAGEKDDPPYTPNGDQG
ncbi:Zinc finger MYM-type protein 4 [Merluccius polli]|uniref:Zinc finger MYM-type protein 4 n=1 Tax=Merluccius polli TaxID=89951 RepID=A0AA47NS80_MERPO|nr:Zinc finger MYM-type protein 4 [Merluccius polli]